MEKIAVEEMDVECEVEVASTSDRSWLFKSYQCIICSGDSCLLRKVRWVKGSPFAVVVTNYSRFTAKHFGSSVSIVFDGYSSIPTMKDHEHSRRVSKVSRIAPEVQVDINGIVVYEQEAFFANATNKQQFVNMLARHLETCGFSIK